MVNYYNKKKGLKPLKLPFNVGEWVLIVSNIIKE